MKLKWLSHFEFVAQGCPKLAMPPSCLSVRLSLRYSF